MASASMSSLTPRGRLAARDRRSSQGPARPGRAPAAVGRPGGAVGTAVHSARRAPRGRPGGTGAVGLALAVGAGLDARGQKSLRVGLDAQG